MSEKLLYLKFGQTEAGSGDMLSEVHSVELREFQEWGLANQTSSNGFFYQLNVPPSPFPLRSEEHPNTPEGRKRHLSPAYQGAEMPNSLQRQSSRGCGAVPCQDRVPPQHFCPSPELVPYPAQLCNPLSSRLPGKMWSVRCNANVPAVMSPRKECQNECSLFCSQKL